METVLVVGSGAREHALAWKLSQSPQVGRVIVAPGNSGMGEWERWPVSLSDGKPAFEHLAKRALAEEVSLVVVGPDNPLAEGIVDILCRAGVLTFGPTSQAARIESSKAFSKELMRTAKIPTAKFWIVSGPEEARCLLKSVPWPKESQGWVVKADGLAFGKGVHVCLTLEEALVAVEKLAEISKILIIEERLIGEELSWMAFCDGTECSLLQPARDYKRLLNEDQGPNTGGMGAFSPVPDIPHELSEKIRQNVFIPVLKEMKQRGSEFRGILYAGLMWDRNSGQYWVLEFNARFGDPEAQALLPRMDGDLYTWCEASAKGDLSQLPREVPFQENTAVYVVGTAQGYPTQPEVGQKIHLKDDSLLKESRLFFGGVQEHEQQWVTQGGRVFGVLGIGSTLEIARDKAYRDLENIHFAGMHYRTDIGKLKKCEMRRIPLE